MLYPVSFAASSFSYASFEEFLKELTDLEELSMPRCRVTVPEGLQEVEVSKITMNQLRNIS